MTAPVGRLHLATAVVLVALGCVPAGAAALPVHFAATPDSLGAIPDGPSLPCPTLGAPRDVKFDVVGLSGPAVDVEVSLTASHPRVGDVDVVLMAPDNGPSHRIFGLTGLTTAVGAGDDSALAGPYLFSDGAASPPAGGWWQAATAVGTGLAVLSGDYRTTESGGPSATDPMPPTLMTPAFAGLASLNGVWTLRFRDACPVFTGSVTAATLTLTPDATPPAAPMLAGTVPASPANHNSPKVTGSAQAGSQVRLYETTNCSDTPAAIGTAAELAGAGIAISVPDNSTTAIRARATDVAGNVSACSDPIAYVETSPPGGGDAPGGGGLGGAPTPDRIAPTSERIAPTGDRIAPTIGGLSLANRTFRVGRRPRGAPRRVRSGTAFRFTLSEPARVSFRIEHRTTGRRVGAGRCRPRSRRNRRGRLCPRYVRIGSFTRQLGAGRQRLGFSGRLRGRAVRVGRYRLSLRARDQANNASPTRTTSFRVVR